MNNQITFTVLGKPEPAGSKRAFVNPKTGKAIVTDANAKSKPWKQEVAARAHEAMQGRSVMTGPLHMTLVFRVARPKGHYGSGRNAGTLKQSAPLFPTSKPDVTKLVRGVEDAMTGVVYRDDAQVHWQNARKVYAHDGVQSVSVTILEGAADVA